MSRSRKKPWAWCSKPWYKYQEHALRRRVKQACHEIEIDFDPDKDWEDLYLTNRSGADWGTKCGWELPPDEGDSTWMHENYEQMGRK